MLLNLTASISNYTNGGLAQEAPYENSATKPPVAWPDKGGIVMKDVVLAYRPG